MPSATSLFVNAGLAAVCVGHAVSAHPPVRSMGVLPGYAECHPRALGVYGDVVVGECSGGPEGGTRAFVYTPELGIRPIGGPEMLLPAWALAVTVTTTNGIIYGITSSGQGFRFDMGPSSLTLLPAAPFGQPLPRALGNSLFVGDLSSPPSGHAPYLWTASGGYAILPPASPGQTSGVALDVTPTGSAVVGEFTDPVTGWREAFFWAPTGGTLGLGWFSTPSQGTPHSVATAISTINNVVVGYSTGGQLEVGAFRYTAQSGMVELGALPGAIASRAHDVDLGGSRIVGECTYPDGRQVAFVWDEGRGMRELSQVLLIGGSTISLGWTLETATDIDFGGSAIIGTGRDPTGQQVGYLARIMGCYPNIDASTMPPVLNVNDFVKFQRAFAAGSYSANCDSNPLLTVGDFTCFMQRFAAGCS